MKKRKLKKLLKQLQAALVAQQVPAAAASRPLNDWLAVFERGLAQRGLQQQTLKNRTSNLKHVRRLWGQLPIKALRPHQVATGLQEFLPRHSSTAQRVLSELRNVYSDAVANDWADTNPAQAVKMPAHHVIRKRLPFSVWLDMRRLATAGPQRWVESMLLLALATGQRRADVAAMRFDDIVTAEDGLQYLRVEQQKLAGKPVGARVEIPLALRLDAIGMTLAEVIEHCRNSAKAGHTLLRKAGGGALEESSLSARFHECILTVCGDDAYRQYEWPSFHEIRSLAARLYRDEGKDPQTLLGHAHHEMTELYLDDRGLSGGTWKRVAVAAAA